MKTYRAMRLPPPQNIPQVELSLDLIGTAVPDPALTLLLAALLILEAVTVDIGERVAVAVPAALDRVEEARAGHADVHDGVDARVRRGVPQLGDEVADGLVVDADGLGVDEDANGREGS